MKKSNIMTKSEVETTERFEEIRKAVEERDRYLKEHPDLIPFQEEIEKRLKSAGSIENRITILKCMMNERLFGLQLAFEQLKKYVKGNGMESNG